MFALHKKQIRLNCEVVTPVCRGEEQCNNQNWSGAVLKSHGRSSRCSVHVGKTEWVKKMVSLSFYLCLVETLWETLLKSEITLFYHKDWTIGKRMPGILPSNYSSLSLWNAKTNFVPLWEFILVILFSQVY